MSLFRPRTTCQGIFTPGFCGAGLQTTLSFVRSEALLQHRMPTQSPAGEVLLSFAAIGTVAGDLQPNKGGIQRLVGGQVVEVAYAFFVPGEPDVQELDRAWIDGLQTEVVACNQWGRLYAEVLLRYVAR